MYLAPAGIAGKGSSRERSGPYSQRGGGAIAALPGAADRQDDDGGHARCTAAVPTRSQALVTASSRLALWRRLLREDRKIYAGRRRRSKRCMTTSRGCRGDRARQFRSRRDHQGRGRRRPVPASAGWRGMRHWCANLGPSARLVRAEPVWWNFAMAGGLCRCSDGVSVLAFTRDMADAASVAFARFGRATGHAAKLNFGDCMTYAVSVVMRLPLLFKKGGDFGLTDFPRTRP